MGLIGGHQEHGLMQAVSIFTSVIATSSRGALLMLRFSPRMQTMLVIIFELPYHPYHENCHQVIPASVGVCVVQERCVIFFNHKSVGRTRQFILKFTPAEAVAPVYW